MPEIPDGVRELANQNQTKQSVHKAQSNTFSTDRFQLEAYAARGKDAGNLRWAMGRQDNQPYQYMYFWVNPNNCSWKVATRTTIQKTLGGAVHHQAPLYGRFDLPVLTIAFQSGNIKPYAYGVKEDIPQGLGNFYRFLHLIDEPNIATNTSNPNFINILYSSPLYPKRGLWLSGFFDENGVTWTDSAESPGMIMGWTANFIVFQSSPPLNDLRKTFQSIGIS